MRRKKPRNYWEYMNSGDLIHTLDPDVYPIDATRTTMDHHGGCRLPSDVGDRKAQAVVDAALSAEPSTSVRLRVKIQHETTRK